MSDQIIDCNEILTIAHVGDLYAQIIVCLSEGKTLSIDCSKVTRVDTSALQLLAAYAREVKSHSGEFVLIEPTDVIRHNAELLGLASYLNIDQNS